jgi:hypothetical protein
MKRLNLRIGLVRAVSDSQQRQETESETSLLSELAASAKEKGLSLFEYLADLQREDTAASRSLSFE